MSGFGVDQGAGGTAVAVLRSTGEPGKASPIRGGGRTEKRTRRREPGKIVAVWVERLTEGLGGERSMRRAERSQGDMNIVDFISIGNLSYLTPTRLLRRFKRAAQSTSRQVL